MAIPPDPAGYSDLIRLDKAGAKRRNDKIDRVPDERLFFSHGVSFHRYFMSVMKKPVTDCVGDRWFATMAPKFAENIRTKLFRFYDEKFLVYTDPRNDDYKLNQCNVLHAVTTSQGANTSGFNYGQGTTPSWYELVSVSTTHDAHYNSTRVDSTVMYHTYTKDFLAETRHTAITTYTTITAYPNVYLTDATRSYTVNSKDLTDLNVWTDLPLNGVTVTPTSTSGIFSCTFDLPADITKYRLTKIKIGGVYNGVAQVLTEKTMDDYHLPTHSIMFSVSAADWNKYFVGNGPIKYGTSIWIEDMFGNGNTFSSMAVVP